MGLSKYLDLKRQLNKPEYWYNPRQIIKRLTYQNKNRREMTITLPPSNQNFYLNENEVIGRSILTMGVYDLIVAESLKRIINPGDLFVDVGANIGYFSRLALEWGARTHSFEPLPKIFERLEKNLAGFNQAQLHPLALSDQEGSFDLYIPDDFEKNEGIASLEPMENSNKVQVKTQRLDQIITEPIRLLKVDVEGHEAAVFKGASKLIELGQVESILFEDFQGKTSTAIGYLDEKGYKVLGLLKTPKGPKLISMSELHRQPKYEPPNFLATKKASNIRDLFASSGWKFYR